MNEITLCAHGFVARLLPEAGGLIASLNYRGRPLLHAPDGACITPGEPVRFGLWPLVPFANRAFGARLLMPDGAARALPVNDPATGACIHGFGWQRPWRVEAVTDASATLRHDLDEGGGPYRYAASLTLSLQPGRASVTLAVENRAGEALPYGIGLHPWFPRDADTRLIARAQGEMRLGTGYRPTGAGPLPAGLDLTGASPLPRDREVAASLIGWSGDALLTVPSHGLTMGMEASEALRHPVLWCPSGSDFVCFEPQAHAIGAPSDPVAAAATPLRMLAPDESLSGTMSLVPGRHGA